MVVVKPSDEFMDDEGSITSDLQPKQKLVKKRKHQRTKHDLSNI
jgi:hypothetical protein